MLAMPCCPHHVGYGALAMPRWPCCGPKPPQHIHGRSDDTQMSPQVTGLSVTSCQAQLVVFHTQSQEDLAVCLHKTQPAGDNRVGELVGVLLEHCRA